MALARRSLGDGPFAESSNLRTSAHVGALGRPSYFGILGLRIPKARRGAHQPRTSAYLKKERMAWHCDAMVRTDQPSRRLLARNSSTSSNETVSRLSCRSPNHFRNPNALEL